jgi:hypothetical protein
MINKREWISNPLRLSTSCQRTSNKNMMTFVWLIFKTIILEVYMYNLWYTMIAKTTQKNLHFQLHFCQYFGVPDIIAPGVPISRSAIGKQYVQFTLKKIQCNSRWKAKKSKYKMQRLKPQIQYDKQKKKNVFISMCRHPFYHSAHSSLTLSYEYSNAATSFGLKS